MPCEKRVQILSSICIEEGPDPKTIKLQESVTKEIITTESVCTQTASAATAATPRKNKLRRDVKVLKQRLKRRNTTIGSLKDLLKIIKKKCDNYSEVEDMIQHNFENIHTISNTTKSNTSNKYSDEMKSFALSLYYYSGKAYLFLRNRIRLPHPATLRRILATHKCNVGFMAEVMEFLKVKAEKDEMNVALIFDAMAIKVGKQYDKGSDKYWGGVDLGGILTSDSETFATEALVFQIVSLKEKFVCPIAYFFIYKISAHLQAQLVLTAIRMLADINIVVRSLTADGTQVNIKSFEILGCNFALSNMKTHFDHPIKPTKVYCILDPAHMIKLARNLFAETHLSSEKGDIRFAYIQKLQDLQEEEGLKLKNKLTRVHVDFFGKKMNVKLAVQVLSSSVADAIDYLKSIGHPSFAGSEATVEYLRYLDRLFDILNAKNPIGKGFKSPLRLNNKHVWTQVFEETRHYLTELKVDGQNIMTHRRKTPVLGLIIDTYSFAKLATDLFDANMTYLLPYKASQDHIEMFFSCVRARGGANDNPTALEFMFIMRKLLFRNSVRPSINANCTNPEYENSAILEFRSAKRSIVEDNDMTVENETDTSDVLMHLVDRTDLSDYKNNILYYISGYIVMKILNKLTCQHCRALLITHRTHKDHDYLIDVCEFSSFTAFVDRGGLKYASTFVFDVVKYIEKLFLLMSPDLQSLNMKKMLNMTLHQFSPKIRHIMLAHPSSDESHELELIKCIGQKYLQLRLRSYGKSLTLKHVGHKATLRQKLRKTVLFSNV